MIQIIFKMFEIAQNITKLRVVANTIIFTTNPILNVKLYITKTNVFVMRFIYAFELIISGKFLNQRCKKVWINLFLNNRQVMLPINHYG